MIGRRYCSVVFGQGGSLITAVLNNPWRIFLEDLLSLMSTEMLFFFSIFKDRITDLQAQTQHFAEVGHFDADSLQDKSRGIAERYEK